MGNIISSAEFSNTDQQVAPCAVRSACEADLARSTGIPAGFTAQKDGIYYTPKAKNGEDEEERWLCSPVRVHARVRNTNKTGWSRLVVVTNPDGDTKRLTLFDAQLTGSGTKAIASLADAGCQFAGGAAERKALIRLLSHWTPPLTLTSVEQSGWADPGHSAYFTPNGQLIGNKCFVLNDNLDTGRKPAALSQGNLEEWRANVALPCAGNPILVLAMSLAFVGPLLDLLEKESGGVHLRGSSSCGKSTALSVAVSVWGDPHFKKSWRTTSNATERLAADHNDSLLALDEIGEIAGNQLSDTIYLLANGSGKSRARSSGWLNNAPRWRVAILSAGEISTEEKIIEGGGKKKAGHEVRIIDIVSDARRLGAFDNLHGSCSAKEFADALKSSASRYYGVAGPAFVRKLIASTKILTSSVPEFILRFERKNSKNTEGKLLPQSARVLSKFALIAIAGELATTIGLTGWSRGEAFAAAEELFLVWLDAHSDTAASGAADRTRAYLRKHGARSFEIVGSTLIGNRADWQDDRFFYISSGTWREIHAGHDERRAAQELAEQGLFIRGEGNNLAKRAPRSIPKRPRVYTVRKSILGEGGPGPSLPIPTPGMSDQSDQSDQQPTNEPPTT